MVDWRRWGLDRGGSPEIRFWSDLDRGGLFIEKIGVGLDPPIEIGRSRINKLEVQIRNRGCFIDVWG